MRIFLSILFLVAALQAVWANIPCTDNTFSKSGLTLTNGINQFTVFAQDSLNRKDTNSVAVNLPYPASLQYDQNGNLVNDGKRRFTYDDFIGPLPVGGIYLAEARAIAQREGGLGMAYDDLALLGLAKSALDFGVAGAARLARCFSSKSPAQIIGNGIRDPSGSVLRMGGIDKSGKVVFDEAGHFGKTKGLTILEKNGKVFWANDSVSAPAALTAQQIKAVEEALKLAYPNSTIQHVRIITDAL